MTIMEAEDKKIVNNKNNRKKTNKKSYKTNTYKKKNIFVYKLISFILIVLSVVTSGYIVYQDLFSLFYMIPAIIVVFLIIFFISFILNKEKLRKWIKNIFLFIAILIIIIEALLLFYGGRTIKFLTGITDTGLRVETFGVYVLNDSSYQKIEDLEGKDVSYINHKDDKNIRKAVSKITSKVKANINYEDTVELLLEGLFNNNSDAIIIDTSYESVLGEEYSDKYKNMRKIKEIDIVENVNTIKSDVDITKDPFAIYISGIDTSGKVGSKARSDVNIVMAVNPKTKNILLINTPRDYYVTLHTKGKKDKLTHAGLYGVEESLKTLSDLFDIDIDYYVRINFTSFIKIVDALGGISVNVPKNFCEQNSKRSFKEEDLICLSKGRRVLNGEQALALARHRHTLVDGDRGRGNNQMLIIEAIINKAMTPKIITSYNSIISALEGRVTTNMGSKEMIKFIEKNKNNLIGWKINSLSATGNDSSGVCYATGSGKAYVMAPDEKSVNNIKRAINRLFNGEDEIIVEDTTTTSTTKNVNTTIRR